MRYLWIHILLFFSASLFSQKTGLLPDTVAYCLGDSAWVQVTAPLDRDAIISWSTPQGIITNTRKVAALQEGRYRVRVVSSQFSAPVTDSTYVKVFFRLRPLISDTTICKGKQLFLDARYTGMRYQWSTGETTQKIRIENPGRYWVKIINGKCVTIDTVRVRTIAGAGIYLPPEQVFCLNDQEKILSVKVNPGTRLIWSTGAITPTIQVVREGVYSVRAEAARCGIETDSVRVKFKVCECEMIVPNSFTPNEDNRNDYFYPVTQCDYAHFNITITDRWGNTVYYSNNPSGKWDGRYKGNLCPEDIYTYRIESAEKGTDKRQVRHGQISLFR